MSERVKGSKRKKKKDEQDTSSESKSDESEITNNEVNERKERSHTQKLYFVGCIVLGFSVLLLGINILLKAYGEPEGTDSTRVVLKFTFIATYFFFLTTVYEFIYFDELFEESGPQENQKNDGVKLTLEVLYNSIKTTVVEGYEERCTQFGANTEAQKSEIRYSMAEEYIIAHKMSFGIDFMTVTRLESMENTWLTWFLKTTYFYHWQLFIHIVVGIHLLCSFVDVRMEEPLTIDGWNLYINVEHTYWPLFPLFLTVLEFIDVIGILVLRQHVGSHVFLSLDKTWIFLYLFISLFSFTDYFIMLTFHVSLHMLFPIRPLLCLCINKNLRKESIAFCQSVWSSMPMFIAWFAAVCSFSILVFLNYGIHKDKDIKMESNWNGEPIYNMVITIVQMMVLMISASQYSSMEYGGYEKGRLSLLIFPVSLFMGMYVFSALIAGMFDSTFGDKEKKVKLQYRWNKRAGIIAAFIVLEHHEGEKQILSNEEFANFLNRHGDFTNEEKDEIFTLHDTDNSDHLDMREFCLLWEKVDHLKPTRISELSQSQVNMTKIFDSWAGEKAFVFLCFITFGVFLQYNEIHAHIVDILVVILIAVHCIVLALRIWAYGGFHRYFFIYCYKGHERKIVESHGSIVDFIIVTLSAIGACIMIYHMIGGTLNEHHSIRLLPALIIFRFFCRWRLTRRIGFLLGKNIYTILNLGAMMMLTMLIFGIISVTFFKNGLRNVNWDDPGIIVENARNFTNFDDLEHAFLFFLQAFFADALHELCYIAQESWATNSQTTSKTLKAVWFVMLYFFVMVVLFSNIFFGVLLNIVGEFRTVNELTQKDVSHILDVMQDQTIADDEAETFYVHDLSGGGGHDLEDIEEDEDEFEDLQDGAM